MFFDLGIYKDKIAIFNERFYDSVFFKDLPKIINISGEIENKIPENQTFVGLFQYGLDIIKIKISEKKSIGKISLMDSRIFRKEIFTYYSTINSNGSSPILRESLETKFRKILLLEKKKRSYIYLSSFLQKTPLELREDDNFYIVNSPELLIKNSEKKYSDYLNNKYNIKYYNKSTVDNTLFGKLEKIDIIQEKENDNMIYYINT